MPLPKYMENHPFCTVQKSMDLNVRLLDIKYHWSNMGFGHAIPHIVERFHDNPKDTFEIYGHDQTRAFCYIDDAVDGTILAMNSAESHNQIYHIGKDEEISLKDLAIYVGEIMDFRGSYRNAITYPGSVARRCPNIKKAVIELGYSPSVELKDAVKRTVMWYKNFFESGQYALWWI